MNIKVGVKVKFKDKVKATESVDVAHRLTNTRDTDTQTTSRATCVATGCVCRLAMRPGVVLRRISHLRYHTRRCLDRVFNVDIERVDINALACPLYRFTQRKVGVYDRSVESLVDRAENESLLLKGPFQSWKYVQPVAGQLRRQLTLRRELVEFVAQFWADSVPPGWNWWKFLSAGVCLTLFQARVGGSLSEFIQRSCGLELVEVCICGSLSNVLPGVDVCLSFEFIDSEFFRAGTGGSFSLKFNEVYSAFLRSGTD